MCNEERGGREMSEVKCKEVRGEVLEVAVRELVKGVAG